MRAPLSWLRELVEIPAGESGRDVAARLIRAGLEVETVEEVGAGLVGSLHVGRVVEVEELTEFKKPIRWCQVDVGAAAGGVRGVICGARNFVAGDLVVVALPGTVLPGGFEIASRPTYGKVSDGMICSERELALGDNHDGIMVLPAGIAEPGDDAAPIIGVGDEVLDIAITPDRGYALSIRGIAREVAIAYGVAFDDPGRGPRRPPRPAGRPRAAGVRHRGSDRLRPVHDADHRGLRPGGAVTPVDAAATRRLRDAPGLAGRRRDQLRHARARAAPARLRHGQTHRMRAGRAGRSTASRSSPSTMSSACSRPTTSSSAMTRGVIGLAGVIGGLHSEIDDDTTSIALEAAHFVPEVIARAGRRHKVSSEAGKRNERGVDRDLAPYASARAAALLLEFGGGHYVGMTAVEAGQSVRVIELPATEPGDVAGMAIARRHGRLAAAGHRLRRGRRRVRDAPGDSALVAAGPHRCDRPGRGGHPPPWLRPAPVHAPGGTAGPRHDP